MLVPEVVLATQQAAAFIKQGGLAPHRWPRALASTPTIRPDPQASLHQRLTHVKHVIQDATVPTKLLNSAS